MTFATLASAAGLSASAMAAPARREVPPVDALLIDETIAMPQHLTAFVAASRQQLPVVGIKLDAGDQAGLLRLLRESRAIVGVSSGATLFCLERIGWGHGFRLTARSQHCSDGSGDDACRQDIMALLSGMDPSATEPAALARAYRPSRADGTLHAWVMHKAASRHDLNQRRHAA